MTEGSLATAAGAGSVRAAHAKIRATAQELGTAALGESSMRELLAPLGLPFAPSYPVGSAAQASELAVDICRGGGRAALKVFSDHMPHKTEHGLIALGLTSPDDMAAAYSLLAGRAARLGLTDAVMVVQPMVPDGTDLFLGCDRDPVFGPVLVAGMGGTTVELFRDVARRLPPVSADNAAEMLASLRSAPLLHGFRGAAPVDTTAFCELVVAVSDLVTAVPELAELDLNPIRVLPDGRCVVLDAVGAICPPEPRPADHSRRLGAPRLPGASGLDLTSLIEPGSVAVVGAARTQTRPGARILNSLVEHGFPGPVYPVNPAGGEIGGLPAYASLADVPAVPDLACVALPAEASVAAVRECVQLGVPAIIVYASGFAEAGPAGRELDEQLRTALAGSATILCGPNTIGIVNSRLPLAATFSQALAGFDLRSAGTALIAQSGAVAGSLVSRELASSYGVGDWVTVGNQTGADLSDYVSFFARRDTTTAIAVFLEGAPDGPRFREALRAARAAAKPVVVFKTGTTDAGRRAVASHSGALAGSGEVYSAVLEEEGAVSVDRMTQLLEVAWTLGTARPAAGPRTGVITTSGGAGSATADLLVRHGLLPAPLASRTLDALRAVLPAFATVENPLDVTAEGAFAPGVLLQSVTAVAADYGIDLVCVVLTSITGSDAVRVAGEISDAAQRAGIPVLVSWLVARQSAAKGMALLAERGVRVFAEPADMVAAAAALVRWHCPGQASGRRPGGAAMRRSVTDLREDEQ
jgi:acyl-CoA synthetase (NDP forming)